MGWLSDTWESVKENASDICHGVLDAAGFIPVFGAIPDVINGCIYAAEGNALDAGMSFAAAIPGVGDIGAVVGKGGKYLIKGGKWLLGKGKKLLKGSGKLMKALKKSKFLGKLAKLGGKLLGKMKVGAKALFRKGKELLGKIADKFKRGCKDGNGCFVKDTLVWTKEGLRKIQEIEKREWIYSKDEHTKEVGLKRVKRVFESKVHTIYTIKFGEKEELKTTNYHPFYVKEKGWLCAIQLQVGDELCTIEGDVKKITSIEKERWEEGIFVYNFEVEDWSTYFVSDTGVFVHNKRPCGKPKQKRRKSKSKRKNSKKKTKKKNPYSHLEDGKSVGPGKDFTAAQKQKMLEENMKRNGGVVKSDNPNDFYDVLTKPKKSKKGVTPDPNEWQFDHIIPKSKGGTNSYSNCQIVSRKYNRTKSNK